MKAIKIIAIIAGLLLAPVNSGLAEPTVEETKKFITARAKQCGSFTAYISVVAPLDEEANFQKHLENDDYTLEISFVNDEVHTKEIQDVLDYERRRSIEFVKVHSYDETIIGTTKLSDLSPIVEAFNAKNYDENSGDKETGYRSPYFVLSCSAGSCWKTEKSGVNIFEEESKNIYDYRDGKVVRGSSGDWFLSTCDFDTAQRMAKAFTHLIKKAGGKEPLF